MSKRKTVETIVWGKKGVIRHGYRGSSGDTTPAGYSGKIRLNAGAPTDNVPIGTITLDTTNDDVYVAQDSAGTHVKVRT